MFNFTTQTIFNSVIETTESAVRAKTAPKGYNVISKSTASGPQIRIGNIRFEQGNIIDIQKKVHTVESLAKVEFDISQAITLVTTDATATQVGDYRIVLYIGLSMNSQDSFYANDFVYKGKPLFIEFPIKAGETAATVANRIVKIANKYLLFQAQEKILDVTAEGSKVIFKGVNGYQQITKAILQKYNPEAAQIDCCNAEGAFEDVVIGVPVVYTTDATGAVVPGDQTMDAEGLRDLADNEIAIEPGLEAFGDYNWIIHNLRLPTLANTNFWSATKSEMPIVGGKYVQFIVRMAVDRDGIAGGILGQRATTVTTHVFYVLDQGTNVSKFQTLLGALKTIKTDADDALANPFDLEEEEEEGGGN